MAQAEARESRDEPMASWLYYAENHIGDASLGNLREFPALALREPRLRVLMPYTSHANLCFSATTAWPYSEGYPVVVAAEARGHCVVHTGSGQEITTDAAGAVLAALPG